MRTVFLISCVELFDWFRACDWPILKWDRKRPPKKKCVTTENETKQEKMSVMIKKDFVISLFFLFLFDDKPNVNK